jgi:hypothetical protein
LDASDTDERRRESEWSFAVSKQHHTVVSILAIALLGCQAAPPSGPARVRLDGIYVQGTQGSGGAEGSSMTAIGFADGESYRLLPSSCNANSCVEQGRYTFDDDARVLTLTKDKTGTSVSYAVSGVSTTPFVPQSALKFRDLVEKKADVVEPAPQPIRDPAQGIVNWDHGTLHETTPEDVVNRMDLFCFPAEACGDVQKNLSGAITKMNEQNAAAADRIGCLRTTVGSATGTLGC